MNIMQGSTFERGGAAGTLPLWKCHLYVGDLRKFSGDSEIPDAADRLGRPASGVRSET